MNTSNAAEHNYLYLTTIGRRSGLEREVEIWFTRYNGCYYVVAEYPTSHWVQNLRACSRVKVRVGEQQFAAAAHVLEPQAEPELHAAVQRLSREKYGWGEGLIVELRPEPAHD